MNRRAAVQTPGEPINGEGAKDAGEPHEPQQDVTEVEALRAQVADLMAAVTHLQRSQAGPKPKNSDDDLPDLRTMDLDKLNEGNTPVLTKQGWVVPATYGADPAKLQQERDLAADRKLLHALASKVSD